MRLELESQTIFRSFFIFWAKIFTYWFPHQIIVSKLISRNLTCFSENIVGNIAIFQNKEQKCCKISQLKMQNAVPPRCMPQFLEKLESWLQRLNTPLSNTPCLYTLPPYFTAARHFSTVSAYSFKWYALLKDGYMYSYWNDRESWLYDKFCSNIKASGFQKECSLIWVFYADKIGGW